MIDSKQEILDMIISAKFHNCSHLSKLQRMLKIIDIFLNKKRINIQTLSSLLEINIRTTYRDLKVMKFIGVPIYLENGVYKLDNEYWNFLDKEEIRKHIS